MSMTRTIAHRVLDLFLSLKTTVVLMLGLLFFFVAGAVVMPVHPAFRTITGLPMFTWLAHVPIGASWWLLGALALLSALVINTIACSVESLLKKRSGRQWLLVISPQVIHIGFMLMLLGHLVSGIDSFKGGFIAEEEASVGLPNGLVMVVGDIDITLTDRGFPTDWRASVAYFDGNKLLRSDLLAANRPSFYRGYGTYLKQVRPYPVKKAVIEVTREPGAPWALGGGIVFMLGTIALVWLKMSREQ